MNFRVGWSIWGLLEIDWIKTRNFHCRNEMEEKQFRFFFFYCSQHFLNFKSIFLLFSQFEIGCFSQFCNLNGIVVIMRTDGSQNLISFRSAPDQFWCTQWDLFSSFDPDESSISSDEPRWVIVRSLESFEDLSASEDRRWAPREVIMIHWDLISPFKLGRRSMCPVMLSEYFWAQLRSHLRALDLGVPDEPQWVRVEGDPRSTANVPISAPPRTQSKHRDLIGLIFFSPKMKPEESQVSHEGL